MERIKRSRSGRSENERQQKYDAIEARASKSALERFRRPAYQQQYQRKYGGKVQAGGRMERKRKQGAENGQGTL